MTAEAARFDSFGLNAKLTKALQKHGLQTALPVQTRCIPEALSGRDIIAQARTGSGKTLAYLLPVLHRILQHKRGTQGWQALILVPTRELCEQVAEEANRISQACGVRASLWTGEGSLAVQSSTCRTMGQVVVSTPGRIAAALQSGAIPADMLQGSLCSLVLDEADLLLLHEYEADLQAIASQVPRACQCMLLSATSNEDLQQLRKLVLHNPVEICCVDLPSSQGAASSAGASLDVQHFTVDCCRDDKLLVVLALLQLGLVRRKVLLFVNGTEAAYRLRLFLEGFGIRSALLSPELPLNSRHHVLQEFNRGLFDYLIATDSPTRRQAAPQTADDAAEALEADAEPGEPELQRSAKQRGAVQGKGRKRKHLEDGAAGEFGVARGIDFRGVNTVINVDMPANVTGYVHRVGRTGRAGRSGTAITLATPQDARRVAELQEGLGTADAGEAPVAVTQEPGWEQQRLRPFPRLTSAMVEALRYRGEDVARMLTKTAIKEARALELRLELLNSERLKAHFEGHPGDLALLQHDKCLSRAAPSTHLKSLPSYLKQAALGAAAPQDAPQRGASGPKRRRRPSLGDPLKAQGFQRAAKRGDKELTDMEQAALKLKPKGTRAMPGGGVLPKRNVRRSKGRKR